MGLFLAVETAEHFVGFRMHHVDAEAVYFCRGIKTGTRAKPRTFLVSLAFLELLADLRHEVSVHIEAILRVYLILEDQMDRLVCIYFIHLTFSRTGL